jgi:hypothetical protein
VRGVSTEVMRGLSSHVPGDECRRFLDEFEKPLRRGVGRWRGFQPGRPLREREGTQGARGSRKPVRQLAPLVLVRFGKTGAYGIHLFVEKRHNIASEAFIAHGLPFEMSKIQRCLLPLNGRSAVSLIHHAAPPSRSETRKGL